MYGSTGHVRLDKCLNTTSYNKLRRFIQKISLLQRTERTNPKNQDNQKPSYR